MDIGLSMELLMESCPENFYQIYTVYSCTYMQGLQNVSLHVRTSPGQWAKQYNAHWFNLKSDVKAAVSVMMDFEMDSINSVVENFSGTENKGVSFIFFRLSTENS